MQPASSGPGRRYFLRSRTQATSTPPIEARKPASKRKHSPTKRTLSSDKKVWSSTHWPFAAYDDVAKGNPRYNLWADKGCLDKFDRLLTAKKRRVGAKAHEKQPTLNFLAKSAKPCGYYIPQETIREDDAERSTGVAFGKNKKLRDDFKKDFLDDNGDFGQNGKTDGSMDVSWWGSCDSVAMAGMMFERPKKAVSMSGVRFNLGDIKGLLTLVADHSPKKIESQGCRFENIPDKVTLVDGNCLEGRVLNLTLNDFRGANTAKLAGMREKFNIQKSLKFQYTDGKKMHPESISCFFCP